MPPESNPPFSKLTGKLAVLVRKHDWSLTPLGPITTWQAALMAVVDMVLTSPFPQCLMVGDALTVIHNDAYETLLDSRPNVLGWPVRDIWPDLWEVIGPLLERARNGEVIYAEDRPFDLNRHGHIETAWFSFGYSPIRDETGQIIAVLNTCIETTDKINAIKKAEASETGKAEFVSYLNHNLRSPIGAMSGLATLLAASQPLSSDQQQYIRALQMSTESALDQLRDLIDTARIETRTVTLDNKPFHLEDLADEIAGDLTEQARAKGLSFTAEVEDEAGTLAGDPSRLRQIIRLIAGNAIKFTEEGGVDLNLISDANGHLTITVSDTGPGITPEQRDTLFTPTEGVKSKYGARMGLTIARTLTRLMGGTIDVNSRTGEGATFIISIPLTRAEALTNGDAREMHPVVSALNESNLSVLLAEDYEPNVIVATTVLQQLGYSVDVAPHGEAAVRLAGENAYLFALMDVQMPGMNGWEATSAIRAHEAITDGRHLPIIGVTAHSLDGDRDRCLAAGMDAFLPKPFTAADLAAKIDAVLNHTLA